MNSPHRSDVQTFKAYLLGTLTQDETNVLEERYFLDRSSLLALEQVEKSLIADYLAGRLSSGDRARFAERYLRNPVLAQKVDAARAGQSATVASGRKLNWSHAALATAAALVIALSGALVYRGRTPASPVQEPPMIAQAVLPPAELTLSPGITKGPGGRKQSQIQAPLPASGLRLNLELPGFSAPVYCSATVSRIAADGRRDAIWNSPRKASEPASDGHQYVAVVLPSALAIPGDYLVELVNTEASVFETYVFRVITSR